MNQPKGFGLALLKREGTIDLFPHSSESRVDIIIGVPQPLYKWIKAKICKSLDRYKYPEEFQ